MIYLISNCTNVKKKLPLKSLLIRNYNFSDIQEASKTWNSNISNSSDDRLSALKMYRGPAWKASLDSVINFSKRFKTKLLISSAGYGLINSDNLISSYGVTFSKGHEDSIHNFNKVQTSTSTTIWWDNINKFDLKELNINASVFIAVPYEYLIAMQNTIKQLIDLFKKKVFIVVVTQKKLPSLYDDYILNFDTRFNTYERGTLVTIIQRCMRWLANEISTNELKLEHIFLQEHINKFLLNYEKYSMEKREILSDAQITNLIKEKISSNEIKSATQGLKYIRSNGYACEQKRFGILFKTINNKVIKHG